MRIVKVFTGWLVSVERELTLALSVGVVVSLWWAVPDPLTDHKPVVDTRIIRGPYVCTEVPYVCCIINHGTYLHSISSDSWQVNISVTIYYWHVQFKKELLIQKKIKTKIKKKRKEKKEEKGWLVRQRYSFVKLCAYPSLIHCYVASLSYNVCTVRIS